jgi:hypothetical protein
MITQSTNLNLIPGQVLPHINVSQYDYGSRTLEFKLFNGNQSFTLTSSMTAKISGTKADMHGFEYDATVDTTNQKIVADLTQQMTAAAGDVTCELIIKKSGERLGTCNFVISVEKAALGDDTIVSDTELPAIIAEATAQMEAAAQSASQAATSAQSAATSASSASTSATNAASSATSAANSATSASNSASSASDSATSAEESAERAEAYSVNTPYIGANGNWWVWNTTQEAYVDTGVDASITVDIEDITMLAPDATPYVTNTGTDTDPVFHLFIPRGKGISGISKTSTSGLVDTYTITYSDGTTTTFTVSNGRGINTISKTSTSGLVDTYTIAYNDNTTSTFTVTNGKTAYQSAVEGGYTGTEAQFNADMASFKTLHDEAVAAASNASTSATSAAGSVTQAHQEYLDAKAQADRAQAYADFIEPHFIIQDNRLYIKDDAIGEFIVVDNRLYMKLIA